MYEPQVQLITDTLFEEVARKAGQSGRRRMNHNFHGSDSDNPHRFLNVLLRETYVRPHRHLNPPKPETFLVLEGAAAVVLFDDFGGVHAVYQPGKPFRGGHLWGIDIAPGVWHTIFPITERAVCFEVKPGPWDPSTDKDFAQWAPREHDPTAQNYLHKLKLEIGLS